MLEYTVAAEQVVPNVSTARAKRAQIFFDSSPAARASICSTPPSCC